MPPALIVDTLKEALNSSHTHWVVDIEDDATFEQIDALIIKKGVYIDQKERRGYYDSAGKAAYVVSIRIGSHFQESIPPILAFPYDQCIDSLRQGMIDASILRVKV